MLINSSPSPVWRLIPESNRFWLIKTRKSEII